MLQIIVGLLCIYIGLAISFEQMVKYFFRYSDHDLTYDEEGTLTRVINWFNKSKNIVGLIGFILGIIIFIAPTPTLQVIDTPVPHVQAVTQRFFGDLIPALLLILSSIVLNNSILGFFNFKDHSLVGKFLSFINNFSFWIGLAIIIFGFLHLVFGSSILF